MRDRGFTLIELTIAGVISAAVVFAGFLALTEIQRSSARQTEAHAVVGEARLAMEVMVRDIRAAGDSLDLLPEPCLPASLRHATAEARCPAVLEAHPWRLALARNAWLPESEDSPGHRTDDVPPPADRKFEHEPNNVVLYRFVPRAEVATMTDADGTERRGVLGRIERVVNPFGFRRDGKEVPPQIAVLLDRVLLDDRMRVDPADPSRVDHRTDFSLFLYQLLTRQGELVGDPDLVGRETGPNRTFLTPPLRFFPASAPAALKTEPPYAPNHPAEIVGLEKSDKAHARLLAASATTLLDADDPGSDLRLVLDRNRIRTVRIAFKVAGEEHPDVSNGLDLDGNPNNGTAPVWSFETTVELKPLSLFTEP